MGRKIDLIDRQVEIQLDGQIRHPFFRRPDTGTMTCELLLVKSRLWISRSRCKDALAARPSCLGRLFCLLWAPFSCFYFCRSLPVCIVLLVSWVFCLFVSLLVICVVVFEGGFSSPLFRFSFRVSFCLSLVYLCCFLLLIPFIPLFDSLSCLCVLFCFRLSLFTSFCLPILFQVSPLASLSLSLILSYFILFYITSFFIIFLLFFPKPPSYFLVSSPLSNLLSLTFIPPFLLPLVHTFCKIHNPQSNHQLPFANDWLPW